MAAPLLLLDVDYLCYRAHYSKQTLEYEGYSTGVVFGVLKDIVSFTDRFLPGAIAFCFDYGKPLREIDYPQYKAARRKKKREAGIEWEEFDEQRKRLRTTYLKQLGYRNIFYKKGYEADDIIASICNDDRYCRVRKIIVSGDKDLYQLLSYRTSIFKPATSTLITEDWFEREFGLTPQQWPDVKSLAGCTTDGIEGVEGVAEKTAARFLQGKLQEKTKDGKPCKAFERCVQGNKIAKRNYPLVALPYRDCPTFSFKRESCSKGEWEQLARKLGMLSISKRAPRGAK